MAGFEAVVFDLFHTLVLLEDAPGRSTPEILGVDRLLWHRTVFEKADHHAKGEVRDPYESLRRIAHMIDPAIAEEKIRTAVVERQGRFGHALRHVRPEVIGGLRQLQAHGIPLALVSNAAFDEINSWSASPLAPLFATALFSCHEGVAKPDPEIYLRAAARLGIAPSLCLYVGDGGSHELEGARETGMRTILFLGLLREALPVVAGARPRTADWITDSLGELIALAKRLCLE
jgi:putative hydrolase of the HAD superfamily